MKVPAQWYCSMCPKSFGRKGDLTRHKLLHAGIKRHVCTICDKAFSQYSGLKTHKNVHTKVKPFVCGFNACSASFGDPSSCARHRKETHRRMSAYRCPYPLCKSSIKRRSAFAAHLKKHNIDITYVDIDAMAPPLPPVTSNVPKRELPVQEIRVVDAMLQRDFEAQQAVDHAKQMYPDVNEPTLHQFPHHQASIPWTHNHYYYEDLGVNIPGPSVLPTLPDFPISNTYNYDNIDVTTGSLFVGMDSSYRLNSPINPIPSPRSKPSFEANLPAVKTEDGMIVNVPRTFDFSSMFKGSALAYPLSHLPTFPIYPDFKTPYDLSVLPMLPWVNPT